MKDLIDIMTGASKAVETAVSGIASVFDVILKPNMDLVELAKIYNTRLDEIILAEEKNGSSYVGGSFHIVYINEVAFETSYALYFQDESKEWFKKEAKSKPQKISFLKETARNELRQAKKVSFEIDAPTPNVTGDEKHD